MLTLAALRDLGHDIDEVWAPDLPRRIQHGNLHYLLELPYSYRREIRQRIRRQPFDVIHVNQGHCFLAARDHARARRPGVFVFRSHGLETRGERVFNEWRRRLGVAKRGTAKALVGNALDALLLRHEWLAFTHADGIIVSNRLDHDFLVGEIGVPPERVACIHQAAPDLYVRQPAKELTVERLKRVLHVSGFGFMKAPHTVAATANALLIDGSDRTFTWVCKARDHAAASAMLTPSARARTSFLDWQPQDALLDVFDQHGVFLFPSFVEGFGKVFIEAMARGLCVVATPAGGMRDLIIDGRNGLLADFHDAQGLAACIRTAGDDPATARRIGAEARRTAEQFTWRRVGCETSDFYEQLLSLPRPMRAMRA